MRLAAFLLFEIILPCHEAVEQGAPRPEMPQRLAVFRDLTSSPNQSHGQFADNQNGVNCFHSPEVNEILSILHLQLIHHHRDVML